MFKITAILIILGCSPIVYFKITRGYVLEKDFSIKGGTLIFVKTNEKIDISRIKEALSREFKDFTVREIVDFRGRIEGYEIIIGEKVEKKEIGKIIKDVFGKKDFSMLYQSPALGEEFFRQATIILIVSIFAMGGMVYYYFRNIASTISIMVSTISDLLLTISFMSVFGIKLSMASFGALLMLLGFSTDSDVLLSTMLVKRKEREIEERIKHALRTEIIMDICAFIAFFLMSFLSTVDVVKNIGQVLLVGLIFDFFTTWGFGYPLIRMVTEHA